MKNDVRYALRMLAKNPGFTVAAVLTMTLGIGLNSAVFSVVNALLFKPMPVAEPDELVGLYSQEPDGFMSHVPISYPDFEDIRDQVPALDDAIAYATAPLALENGHENELVVGEMATGNYFRMLGVDIPMGRSFSAADDTAEDPQLVAVLHHGTWQRRYGGDPEIVGQSVRLNGHLFTILGVAPEGFDGLVRGLAPELWVPMQSSRTLRVGVSSMDGTTTHRLDNRRTRWLWSMGRLAPNATLDDAMVQVETLGQRLAEQYPEANEERTLTAVAATQVRVLPGVDKVLYAASAVIMGLVTLVLLISCANLANMFLARTLSRRKEIATRLALGAGKRRIARQLLTESLSLALLGGGFGLALAYASNVAIDSVRLPLPVQLSLGLALDARVILFTLGVAVMTALLFGLAPVRMAARADLAGALRDEGRGMSGGAGKRRLQNGLVVAQIALSLLLLICAGLSLRSMGNARNIDPGFDASQVAMARFSPDLLGYERSQSENFYRDLQARLRQLPNVTAVSTAVMVPLNFEIRVESAAPEGQDTVPADEWPNIDGSAVGPGYFETMGVQLLRGRAFSEDDTAEKPRVAVINEALAKRFWPGEDALGKRLRVSNPEDGYYEVIGIAADSKVRTLGEAPRPYVYRNLAQNWSDSQMVLVRTADDPAAILSPIRNAARELDERIAISSLETVEDAISVSLLLPRMGATLFGLFGLVGLLLASVGIYGVMAYAVSQRTHEIGIRMAMGAQRGNVQRMVVAHGMKLTALGLMLGLGGAMLTTRALSAVLYGISATDGLTFAAVSFFLSAVAFLACYIPAWRASRVDPLTALRYE